MMPKRVLQVLGGLDAGGAETFVMNLYRAIDTKKIQFDFIKHVSHEGIFENEIVGNGGRIFKCPQYTGKNHFAYCKWWDTFFIEHPEYSVVHGHVRSTAAIYLKVAKKHGIITIAHSHSTSNGRGIAASIKNIMQLPIRYTADFLFACSDNAGSWLYGKKAIAKPNYRMIPNGIDLKRFFFDIEKRDEIRKKLNIPKDTFVIGNVGRMTVPKNHKFMIELFAKFYEKRPNSRLLLIGDGELLELIKNQCSQLGIEDAVIFTGAKLNTEDYYQAMDVFVFPSLWEGLGIVAIEAQANGLNCLVSENVPKEAVLTNSTKVISLQAMDIWLKELEKLHSSERNKVLDERLKQYDIYTIANWLQNFYLKQYEKVNL